MSVTARLAGFAAVLVVVLAASFGVGRLAAPTDPPPGSPPTDEAPEHPDGDHG